MSPFRSSLETPWRAALVVGCAYEIVAVVSNRVPTITSIVQNTSRLPWVGRIALWLWLGAIVDHFIYREPSTD